MTEGNEILRNRRTVYLTCLGADIYMFAMLISQYASASAADMLIMFNSSLSGLIPVLDGMIMLVSVMLGAVLLWLYAAEEHRNGQLFAGVYPVNEILGRNCRMNIGKFICFAAVLFVLQIIAMMFLDLTELVLNIFGFTLSYSPALNADYSVSFPFLLYAVLIGPAVEELVFRGFILKALKPCGKLFAVVVSALMFSLMHGDIQQLLFTFFAGLLFGYIAMQYSVWASFLLHIVNNGFYGEFLAYLQERLPEMMYGILMLLFAMLCIVLTVLLAARGKAGLSEFIHSEKTGAGAKKALFNRWFIAFAAFGIAETCMTVAPLQ